MLEPPRATEVAGRLETNWQSLRPIASRDVEMPGVAIEKPNQGFATFVPPIVRQAIADATPPDGPGLEVVKLAEVVNGTLVRLVDDATDLPRSQMVHIVVNVITVRGEAVESRTYEVAAQPVAGGTDDQPADPPSGQAHAGDAADGAVPA